MLISSVAILKEGMYWLNCIKCTPTNKPFDSHFHPKLAH